MTCEVCQKNPAKGVASSVFGPISHAYCQECLSANREVYSTLVVGLAGVGRDEIAEWAKPFIAATCALHNKTDDEFWADVDKLTEEMARPDRPRPDGRGQEEAGEEARNPSKDEQHVTTLCIRRAELVFSATALEVSSVCDDIERHGVITTWCGESFAPDADRRVIVSVDAALRPINDETALCPTCVNAISNAIYNLR